MERNSPHRRPRRKVERVGQPPWRKIVNPYPPFEVLSADEIEAIHLGSFHALESIGMEVLDHGARDILARAGADVDHAGKMVRFDRFLIEELVAKAPPQFTLRARNPDRDIPIGGDHIVFCSVGGPVYCSDLDRGRRSGTLAELRDFLRVVQSLDILHHEGGGFAPMDLPAESSHLDVYHAQITLSDKSWAPWALGHGRAADAIDMACIGLGVKRDELARNPALAAVINTNSPLRLDTPMSEGLIEMARAGQAVIITPFTLSGAMSPVTLAGALTQQNAEVLAGIALAQAVNPGTPVIYGSFTSNVDMKSGSPAFGTPEYVKAALASGQLARRYRLPFRSSNATASNAVDAQAAYESEMSLWATVMGHANLIKHAAGWLEGGLTASFEKLIIDAEMLQMLAEVLRPIEVTEETLGLEAMAEVGPGGHFFGAAHTMERYQTAFYEPLVSERRNHDAWKEAGSPSLVKRANAIWKRLLAEYQPPPLEPAVDEELKAFVARRKREISSAA